MIDRLAEWIRYLFRGKWKRRMSLGYRSRLFILMWGPEWNRISRYLTKTRASVEYYCRVISISMRKFEWMCLLLINALPDYRLFRPETCNIYQRIKKKSFFVKDLRWCKMKFWSPYQKRILIYQKLEMMFREILIKLFKETVIHCSDLGWGYMK